MVFFNARCCLDVVCLSRHRLSLWNCHKITPTSNFPCANSQRHLIFGCPLSICSPFRAAETVELPQWTSGWVMAASATNWQSMMENHDRFPATDLMTEWKRRVLSHNGYRTGFAKLFVHMVKHPTSKMTMQTLTNTSWALSYQLLKILAFPSN